MAEEAAEISAPSKRSREAEPPLDEDRQRQPQQQEKDEEQLQQASAAAPAPAARVAPVGALIIAPRFQDRWRGVDPVWHPSLWTVCPAWPPRRA